MALPRVGEVRDQAGELLPVLTPDATGVWFEESIMEAFKGFDAVVVCPEETDASVGVFEFKWTAPPRTMMHYLAFGRLGGTLIQSADYGRLSDLAFGRLGGTLIQSADYGRLSDLAGSLTELSADIGVECTPRLSRRQERIASLPHDLAHRLLSFAGLPRGWDGYGGEPVEHHTVERVIETLNSLYVRAADEGVSPLAPVVGPTPGGSIQLEWDYPEAFLSVEIPAGPEPLAFYLERSDGEEMGKDAASLEDLWEIVKAELVG